MSLYLICSTGTREKRGDASSAWRGCPALLKTPIHCARSRQGKQGYPEPAPRVYVDRVLHRMRQRGTDFAGFRAVAKPGGQLFGNVDQHRIGGEDRCTAREQQAEE